MNHTPENSDESPCTYLTYVRLTAIVEINDFLLQHYFKKMKRNFTLVTFKISSNKNNFSKMQTSFVKKKLLYCVSYTSKEKKDENVNIILFI